MNFIRSITCICLLIIYIPSFAQDETAGCNCVQPDFAAPAGIYIDHVHSKNEWMLSYRFMQMNMKGSQQGRTRLSQEQVYNNYIMAPESMRMQMHMLMLMYGLSDRISLMAMSSFAVNFMEMSMMDLGNTTGHVHSGTQHNGTISRSSGITDTKIYALFELFSRDYDELLLSGGVTVPTGKISAGGYSMTGEQIKLPYSMQPGTGNFSIVPGITYTWQRKFSGGVQMNANIRTGRNKLNYRWGHEANLGSWISYNWNDWLSNSLRSDLTLTEKITGFDSEIAGQRGTDPAADINNYGGSRATLLGGLNILLPSGKLKGLRISAEYGLPFYQNLNGIQMRLKSTFYTSIQYGF